MKRGYIYIMITTILFSSMEIVLKTISGVFNPIQLTFTRFLIGGLILLPFALNELKKKKLHLKLKDLIPFLWIGFIGVTVSMTLYQMAVSYTEASVVAVLFSSNPLFVMLFAYLFIGEPIFKRNIMALILDIIGIVFVINPLRMKLSPVGVVLTLLSTLLFAVYGVCGKKQSKSYGGIVNTCFGFLFGSAEMMLMSLLTHISVIAGAFKAAGMTQFVSVPFFQGYSVHVLPQFLYVCIGVTGIGFASYFIAMEKTSANTASLVFFFKPILAPVMALVILGESISINRMFGILFILAGSLTNIIPAIIKTDNGQEEPYETVADE